MNAPATMIGPNAFGRMWRRMIRPAPAPFERAASTNSFSFSASVSPRTRRATPVQFTIESVINRSTNPFRSPPSAVSRSET